MTEPIKPALTAEEWEREKSMDEGNMGTPLSRAIGYAVTSPEYTQRSHFEAIHGLAALCLAGQPFGFTREMVNAIRECVGVTWDQYDGTSSQGKLAAATLAGHAADRIEALLPPEK